MYNVHMMTQKGDPYTKIFTTLFEVRMAFRIARLGEKCQLGYFWQPYYPKIWPWHHATFEATTRGCKSTAKKSIDGDGDVEFFLTYSIDSKL